MPQIDVFITARLRVEAEDDVKAEGFVLAALDARLATFLVSPRVVESNYSLSTDGGHLPPVVVAKVNHRRRRG